MAISSTSISALAVQAANYAAPVQTVNAEQTSPPVESSSSEAIKTGQVPDGMVPRGADAQTIEQAMKAIREALPEMARNLQFSIDHDTGKTVVKIVDPSTEEVIRQIPSEELLALSRNLSKSTGLFVKQDV